MTHSRDHCFTLCTDVKQTKLHCNHLVLRGVVGFQHITLGSLNKKRFKGCQDAAPAAGPHQGLSLVKLGKGSGRVLDTRTLSEPPSPLPAATTAFHHLHSLTERALTLPDKEARVTQ
jgi:hypothetical protein